MLFQGQAYWITRNQQTTFCNCIKALPPPFRAALEIKGCGSKGKFDQKSMRAKHYNREELDSILLRDPYGSLPSRDILWLYDNEKQNRLFSHIEKRLYMEKQCSSKAVRMKQKPRIIWHNLKPPKVNIFCGSVAYAHTCKKTFAVHGDLLPHRETKC